MESLFTLRFKNAEVKEFYKKSRCRDIILISSLCFLVRVITYITPIISLSIGQRTNFTAAQWSIRSLARVLHLLLILLSLKWPEKLAPWHSLVIISSFTIQLSTLKTSITLKQTDYAIVSTITNFLFIVFCAVLVNYWWIVTSLFIILSTGTVIAVLTTIANFNDVISLT